MPTSERSSRTVAEHVAVSAALLPVLLILRVYEVAIVRASHVLPSDASVAVLRGIAADAGLVLWTGALLAIPLLPLGRSRPLLANRIHRVVLAAVATLQVMLLQYLAVTLVPLGADVFGYSTSDIAETVMSSHGMGVLALLPLAIAAGATWWLTGLARRIRVSRPVAMTFFVLAAVTAVVPRLVNAQRRSFASDAGYFLSVNTTSYFAADAARHFVGRAYSGAGPDGGPTLTGYPLLHRSADTDVLGPLLSSTTVRPNIVLVVVEGLGRDFVGSGARYGGFTPFLDSLTTQSLYWNNFLSTSGRTFGVLPGLLASLPPAEGGFMELGAHMPRHMSLVSLLKARGYATSYFTGTDGHFDMIDLFMGRQGVDSFIDASRFGPGYERQPAGEGGFSWGYGDRELFRRSFESHAAAQAQPRLDVFLTITTHEPFIPPQQAAYEARFRSRLASLTASASRRAEYEKYHAVFETLLYLDDALRYWLGEYAKRPEYRNTIFIITGDHRLIPIPPDSRIDRYRVPFIIFSPMVRAPRTFSSVSSHLDVTPTLLAYLHRTYGMTFPDSVAWQGTGLDTTTSFRNGHALALMRTKSEVDEYLDGLNFLSGDEVFSVDADLHLTPVADSRVQATLRAKLTRLMQVSRYVTTGDRLFPATASDSVAASMVRKQDSAFAKLALTDSAPEALFATARSAALSGNYDRARVILEKLLRDRPGYHDARALYGRTFAWQRRFDEARPILIDLVQRAPEYADGYSALVDVELWSGNATAALKRVDEALVRFPGNPDLEARKVRALDLARSAKPK